MTEIHNVWRDTIKSLSISHKLPLEKLLALAPNNDPFYIGSDTEIANAVWVYGIWNKMVTEQKKHSVYARGMHYWYSSFKDSMRPDGTPYINSDTDWSFMKQAVRNARYFNLIPYDRITDEKNPAPIENSSYYEDEDFSEVLDSIDIEEIVEVISSKFSLIWNNTYQPYHLEVWSEKDIKGELNAMSVLRRYNADLIMGEGELSITSVNLAMKRIAKFGKPTRIFYISDFDPKGFQMPISIARKFEWFSKNKDIDIKLKPIALTLDQYVAYELPRKPIKLGKGGGSGAKAYDTMKDKFEHKFGEGATELNALEGIYPGELSKIIEQNLKPYYNFDIQQRISLHNDRVTSAIRKSLESDTSGIEEFIEKLDFSEAESIADSWDTNPGDTPLIDEDDKWLFDSTRDYGKQLEFYKRYYQNGSL